MEQALRALLKAGIAGVPIDWGMNVQSAAAPRITLFLVSGGQAYSQSGPVDLRMFRVQVDCYGATYLATKGLARSVTTFLGGRRDATFAGIFLDAERDFAIDTEQGEVLFRTSLDFMIHHKGD